jgi:hypothetical protein
MKRKTKNYPFLFTVFFAIKGGFAKNPIISTLFTADPAPQDKQTITNVKSLLILKIHS